MLPATQTTKSTDFKTLRRAKIRLTNRANQTADEIIPLAEVEKAAERIAPFVNKTPLLSDEDLSRRFNSNFYLKYELLQKTGAFKARGAFNKILTLSEEEKRRGIVAVSGGNHAQAVAYAAAALDCKSLILMPGYTPRNYVEKTENYGATVELCPTMAEAFDRAEQYGREGLTFVHPFDDEAIIAGQATIALEILTDAPQVTDVICSIGGGGMAGGVASVIKQMKPNAKIWGVETRGADAMSKALETGEVVHLQQITSIARTLGAPSVSNLTLKLARKYLESVTLVDDAEAVREMFYLLENAKVLTEPATSCNIAAAEKLRENFDENSHVVVILCGGNTSVEDLCRFREEFDIL